MKSNWKTVTLESVCRQITDGSHFSPKTADSGFPYITVRDIENDLIDFDNCKFVSADDFNQLLKNGCKPNKGDVLFSKDGTVGKVALVNYERDFVVLSSLAILRPDNNQIDSAFLKYVLKSPAFLDEAIGKKTGVAIRRIILRNLKAILVPVPPLSEQQRIVGILDEAFDGIATAKANAEQNLQNARALFESHLQSVFTQRGEGWEKKPLTAVCDAIFAGGDVPKGNSSKTETDEYRIPIFTNGEKNKGLYGYTNMARVTEPSITISARGTIGYSEIRKESYYPAIRLIVVIPKKEILDLSFLYYAIESTDIGHSGTSIPQLTVPMVSGFTIPVPPIAVQQMIVGQIDALREETQRLESLYQRKLAALDELKKSLLHQAFSGML